MNNQHKHNKKQLQFIFDLREEGYGWQEIADKYNLKFGTQLGTSSMRGGYTRARVELASESHPLASFTPDGIGERVRKARRRNGLYFVTSAAPTTSLDYSPEELRKAARGEHFEASNIPRDVWKSLQNFLGRTNAELVVLPGRAHVPALRAQPQHYDPLLRPHIASFATEFRFNHYLRALEAQLNPQQINPLTGLRRMGRGRNDFAFRTIDDAGTLTREVKRFKTSLLVAHSKQMMEVLATGNSTHPRIIHSTGYITRPAYRDNRIGRIAEEDHVLGGLIVLVRGDLFHVWQVQFREDGSFCTPTGTRYYADGRAEKERIEAVKMGDIHPGHESRAVLEEHFRMWELTRPRKIFLEDFFDGGSITHHNENRLLTKQLQKPVFHSLADEIAHCRRVLMEVRERAPADCEIVLTASNHPEAVIKWLERGGYLRDSARPTNGELRNSNYHLGHQMVVWACEDLDPLQKALDLGPGFTWHKRDDDYFVEGVQMGAHGDIGLNGSKPGKQGLEATYQDAMTAHTHTPAIFHQLYIVGHTSVDRHGYNTGPSTWIPCSGNVYRGGQKCLTMVIGGKSGIVELAQLEGV